MAGLIALEGLPQFEEIRSVLADDITDSLRTAVKKLHEVDEIEVLLRNIFNEPDATPHGPAEIVDILTHKLTIGRQRGLAAFILKGRSSRTVRPKDISHQIYRLEKISGLRLAVLGYTGILLDAAREEFASICERLRIDYAYLDATDLARLFVAYGQICPRDGTVISGGRCQCGYAPKLKLLNVLQRQALRDLPEERRAGRRKALIVMPTGSGKTRVAAGDALESGARSVLYVAHAHEILDVAEAEFGALFGAEAIVRLGRGPWPNRAISVGTVQQLARHPDRIRERRFDYVVIDEFHHASAESYRRVIEALDRPFLLGMTATPFRGDRQDIAKLCDDNVPVNFTLRTGINTGILAPYHYRGCFDDIDYSDLSITGYSVRDLERKLVISARHRAVAAKWRELCEGQPSLAFCCSEDHARKVASAFVAAGIPAAAYLGTTRRPERKVLIEQLRQGDLKILCTVDVLNEGADIPFVECLLFLRPTESKRIFFQQLGRGLRRSLGKPHCTVIDFIGNFRNAYHILDYHDLRADAAESDIEGWKSARAARDVLDLPLNCTVVFEDRVLDIFDAQIHDPRHATRTTIGRILVYRYLRLSKSLGHEASRKEVDRYDLLDTRLYKKVFGTWEKFVAVVRSNYPDGS